MMHTSNKAGERIDLSRPLAYSTYQRHANRYIFASKFTRGKMVLDIACGPGLGSKCFLERGAQRVVGGDISSEALAHARIWAMKAEFVLMSAEQLPFRDNSFDVIVSLETIEHLNMPEKFLAECKRVLKEGSILCCSTPNKKALTPFFRKPGNPYHAKEFSAEDFHDMVAKYFTDVTLYGQHMLGLKARAKLLTISLGAHIFRVIPSGNKLKEKIRRSLAGRLLLKEPHFVRLVEDMEKTLDRDFAVIPFSERFFSIPETVIVVVRSRDISLTRGTTSNMREGKKRTKTCKQQKLFRKDTCN